MCVCVCVCVRENQNWATAVRPRRIGIENDMIPNVCGVVLVTAMYCHGRFNERLA